MSLYSTIVYFRLYLRTTGSGLDQSFNRGGAHIDDKTCAAKLFSSSNDSSSSAFSSVTAGRCRRNIPFIIRRYRRCNVFLTAAMWRWRPVLMALMA